MLYGPRTDEELAVVWQLIEDSYDYARGPHDTRTANGESSTMPATTLQKETS